MEENPFREGVEVVFVPDRRTIGWLQHSFERWGLIPGSVHFVSAVRGDTVEVDGNPDATMHWSVFKAAASVGDEERAALRADFERRKT